MDCCYVAATTFIRYGGNINMWLLNFVPDDTMLHIVDAALVIGIVGTIVSSLFRSIPYIQLISAMVLLFGSYSKGVSTEARDWQDKITTLQQKLDTAEAASKETTVRVETQVVEHVKYIKEKTHAIDQNIQQNQTVINADCTIPDVARVLYNRAVNNEVPERAGNTSATGSKIDNTKSNGSGVK